LLDEKDLAKQEELMMLYESLGVRCFSVSALQDDQHELETFFKIKLPW